MVEQPISVRRGGRRRPVDLNPVLEFLGVQTPDSWIQAALENLELLLVDHANCEKKAASTALSLLYRYVDRPELLDKLARFAREELRHFEQVVAIMRERGVRYEQLTASRYAAGLMDNVGKHEPDRLVDTLIVGALIEARSCERFSRLVLALENRDRELANFYYSLLRSEARHFEDYMALAAGYNKEAGRSDQWLADRVQLFRTLECNLVLEVDPEIRFHSGVPA